MPPSLLTLRKPGDPPRVIAHRAGSALAPENSLPAIRIAKHLRVDGIEIDVRAGRHGEVMVIHDATLQRTTTGRGRVADHSLRELRQFAIDRRQWTGPLTGLGDRERRYRRVHIPTLQEALKASNPLPLVIEVKEQRAAVLAAREVVRARAWLRSYVMSFETEGVARVRQQFPRVKVGHLIKVGWTGRLWGRAHRVVEEALRLRAHFVCVDARGCSRALVKAAHRRGLPVWVWTVDRTEEADRLTALGVDALITNRPDMIQARMAQWKEWLGWR